MYVVYRLSPKTGERKKVKAFSSYDLAWKYCDDMNGIYTDISGIEWDLEIEEEI